MKKSASINWTISVAIAVFLIAGSFMAANSNPAFAKAQLYTGKPAKYVFLFIGDGMGIPERITTYFSSSPFDYAPFHEKHIQS